MVGFFEKQYSARCQMHAVNNALERNHLTFEDIERVRIKRVKAFKLKNSGEKVPDLGNLLPFTTILKKLCFTSAIVISTRWKTWHVGQRSVYGCRARQ